MREKTKAAIAAFVTGFLGGGLGALAGRALAGKLVARLPADYRALLRDLEVGWVYERQERDWLGNVVKPGEYRYSLDLSNWQVRVLVFSPKTCFERDVALIGCEDWPYNRPPLGGDYKELLVRLARWRDGRIRAVFINTSPRRVKIYFRKRLLLELPPMSKKERMFRSRALEALELEEIEELI